MPNPLEHIRPGDLIDWVYTPASNCYGRQPSPDNNVWSSVAYAQVNVGSRALVVGVADDLLVWVSCGRVHQARGGDIDKHWAILPKIVAV